MGCGENNQPDLHMMLVIERWGLMTITTVGYDSSPKTLLGKVVIIATAILHPIVVIAVNFHRHFQPS